jgi:hypothetical protein
MLCDAITFWIFSLTAILIVTFSHEFGYRLGCIAHRRSSGEKESPVSVITGSVLGLVAFMLAFTFGMVAKRFDDRKELVRMEANDIRTTWLRSDFLPEQDQVETKFLLQRYLDQRLAFTMSGDTSPLRAANVTDEANTIHSRLWKIAADNARKDMNSDVAALYIDSLNKMIETHFVRVTVALQIRIPLGIWLILLSLIFLGIMGLGYQTGIANSKRSLAQPILALSFAMVIGLIAELDRPYSSLIKI